MAKFADLGMDFPLFEAPISEAAIGDGGECVACGTLSTVRFEDACYRCFRDGRVEHTIDTEYGMVGPEEAAAGVTHGLPLNPAAYRHLELVPHDVDPNFPDERWYGVRFDSADLQELVRTPGYHTWQGERWLFCCRKPSIFIGEVTQENLEELARSRGMASSELLAQMLSLTLSEAEELLPVAGEGVVVYAFRCSRCDKLRAHSDCD